MYLTWLWLIPFVAALAVWALPAPKARVAANACSIGVLAYSLWLLVPYSSQSGLMRLQEITGGILGIRYHVGVDGISLLLCWLTALLTSLALTASWAQNHSSAYWAAFLGLESALFGVFTSQNLFYFYIFWDVALIPMFFIIGLWGSEGRFYAALKFLLYTFCGSLFLLVGIVALVTFHHASSGTWTWGIPDLAQSQGIPAWIFLAMALGFAVKIPLFPLHNWLPDAHTEAPAAGSVLLAGCMLKMGVYGFLRILIPIFPELSAQALPYFCALGVVNILYGALCAMVQTDLKRLVAYTSVSHLGFCVLGLFSLTVEGIAGGSLQMVNHGLSTGGLFLLVGMLYERAQRRGLGDFGRLAEFTPSFAFFFALLLLSSIGLPGLNGFVGEVMVLAGAAKISNALAAFGLGGAVLAAAYGLPAFQRLYWEPVGPESVSAQIADMTLRERAILWVLSALILALGLYPKPLLQLIEPTVLTLTMH